MSVLYKKAPLREPFYLAAFPQPLAGGRCLYVNITFVVAVVTRGCPFIFEIDMAIRAIPFDMGFIKFQSGYAVPEIGLIPSGMTGDTAVVKSGDRFPGRVTGPAVQILVEPV